MLPTTYFIVFDRPGLAFASPDDSNRTAPKRLMSHHHNAISCTEFDQLNLGEISVLSNLALWHAHIHGKLTGATQPG